MTLLRMLGIDAGGYDRWGLQLAGSFSPWVVALSVLAVGAGVLAWWQLRGRLRPWRRNVLLGLRLGVLALLLVLFLEPEVQLLKTIPVRSQVLVAVDRTPSMSIADAAEDLRRQDAVREVFDTDTPWEQLETDHDVRYLFFSGRGEDFQSVETSRGELAGGFEVAGAETDLAAVLAELARLSRERETAGTLLVSDGADLGVLGELVADPGALSDFLRRNELLPAGPLSTAVVGGEAEFTDLAIREVVADEYGFIRNQVDVKVRLATQSVDAQQVPVTISLGGEVVATTTAQLPDEDGEVSVKLGFSPTRVGDFVYSVDVPVLAGERLVENNRRQFKIKIIRDKVRVLHVVGRPSWDVRFLRRTLKEDPNIDLVSFMILRELVQIPFREHELSLIPFPTDEIFDEKLHTFDLVIFQNFHYNPRYGISPKHLRNIREFVTEDGGGFVMIGGEQSFSAGRFSGTPIEDVLPVSLRFSNSLLDEGKAISRERFSPQLAQAGRLHPVTRLHYDPTRSAEMWQRLPPLDGMNRTGDVMPGAVALLTHPKFRTPSGEPAPVVAAGNVGKGRSLSIATDSSWYWNFFPVDEGGTNEAYLSFWREAIRWLTRDPALKQLNVTTNGTRYRPEEPVEIEVSVLDPEYRPVDGAEVDVRVRSMDGDELCSARAEGGTEGRYQTVCKAAGTGYLEVEAEARKGGVSLGSDLAYVEVIAVNREFERTTPDAPLLELLADLGEGEALQVEDGALSDDPKIVTEEAYRVMGSKEVPLWDTAPALILLLGLACAEWWLRRRWGMA